MVIAIVRWQIKKKSGQPLISFLKDLPNGYLESQCVEQEHELGERVPGDAPLYQVKLPLEKNGEGIIFHVLERRGVYASLFDTPAGREGRGDAVIAGGAVSGTENILVSESTVNSNLGLSALPSPQSSNSHILYTGYIKNFSNLDNVVATCNEGEITSSSSMAFYCNGNINNLNLAELNGKVVVAEQGISMYQNNNSSVSDVAIVAGGAINFNGNNANAFFSRTYLGCW